MKKTFKTTSIFLVIALVFSLCSCSQTTSPKRLLAVMNNEESFIDEKGNVIHINDFQYSEGMTAKPSEYTFVDFDSEGIDELVVKISDSATVYLVLRDSGEAVYGYLFYGRSLQSIRTSGCFIQTGGAQTNYYCHISFDENSYSVSHEAICDSVIGKYELYGEPCSVDEMQEYLKEWSLLPDVTWVQAS